MSETEQNKDHKCIVCLDFLTIFKHPIELDCNHNICVKCLHHLQSNSCPLCRQPFQILVSNLLPNFKMITELEKTLIYNCQTLIQEQNKEYKLFLQEHLKSKKELDKHIGQQLYQERRLFLEKFIFICIILYIREIFTSMYYDYPSILNIINII